MKILFISSAVGNGGGGEKFCLQQAFLARAAGHEVKILSSSPDFQNFIDYPVSQSLLAGSSYYKTISFFEKICLIPSVFFNRNVYSRVTFALKDFCPDVVHLHRVKSLSPAVYFALRGRCKKVVMTLHDHYLTCASSSRTYGDGTPCKLAKCRVNVAMTKRCVRNSYSATLISLAEFFIRRFISKDLKTVGRYLVPSKFLLSSTERAGIHLEKLVYHPNFSCVSRLDLAPKEYYFAYIGRLSEEKGIFTLLEAAALLPNARFRLIGAGPLEGDIRQIIWENGLTNVELVGTKNGIELEEIIARASAVILPSVCYENAPLAVIESFRLGTAVIGSDRGGISEMIKNGENGYLFESGSAVHLSLRIEKFQVDLLHAYELGSNAKAGSGIYSPESHVARLNAIYN